VPVGLVDDATLASVLWKTEVTSSIAAIGHLRRALGAVSAAATIAEVIAAQVRGEPWRVLGPPVDRRDELCRRQSGGAVLLHRALVSRVGKDRAFELLRAIVLESGLDFASALMGDIDPARDAAGDLDKTRAVLEELVGRMPNAEGEITVESRTEARFDITRCRFADLLRAVDAPEIGPIFCEVDDAFFVPERTPVRFRRTLTLATGADKCDFRFSWDLPGEP
jgi:hypothetical protein